MFLLLILMAAVVLPCGLLMLDSLWMLVLGRLLDIFLEVFEAFFQNAVDVGTVAVDVCC